MGDLRTVVVLDHQNMHLQGYRTYVPRTKKLSATVLEPAKFANELIAARNLGQQTGRDRAVLAGVEVYRGLPSGWNDQESYKYVLTQNSRWQRDPRVSVTARPMKYTRTFGPKPGQVTHHPHQKGVDVLIALAVLRAMRRPDVDLVILASHDSDLRAVLDEAIAVGGAKIETCCWAAKKSPATAPQLRPTAPAHVWNTRLGESDFLNSIDHTPV